MFSFTSQLGKPSFAPLTKSRFQEHVKEHDGQVYDIIPRKKKRTLSQNAYVHVLFQYIADETGESLERVKVIEKRRHLSPKEITMFGEKHMVLPSTADLNNTDMSEFIERVLADCAFLGIIVPDRETLGYLPK